MVTRQSSHNESPPSLLETKSVKASACEVLVVEDDREIAATLVDILQDDGIASHFVTNGQEALRELEGGLRPGVILLDLRMPVMTGWEFLRRLRTWKAYRDVPVVIVSGVLDRAARDIAQAAFRKPPDLNQLLHAVNALLH